MKVRDRTKTEYKGRLTDALDEFCPCRRCYNPHDCGYRNSVGRWIINMQCLTRYHSGCPDPKPKPVHIIKCKPERRRSDLAVKCYRCGQRLILSDINFINMERN